MAEFNGYIVGESARAWKFQDHFWSDFEWMPKTQVTIYREEGTDEVRLVSSNWLDGPDIKNLIEFSYREVVPYDG